MKQKKISKIEKPKQKTVSASERIYHDLRQQIIDMTLLPGMRIGEHEIAARHGVSRTPVHEAVQKLAKEGLTKIRPRVGTFVSPIPLDILEEVMVVRTALENAVIAKAVERATRAGIAKLRKILDQQASYVKAGDQKGVHATDEAFHATLSEVAEYPNVWPIILQAKVQIDRYRLLTLKIPGRLEQVLAEHKEILSWIEKGDAARAVEAMKRHLSHVLPNIEDTKIKHPEFFPATPLKKLKSTPSSLHVNSL